MIVDEIRGSAVVLTPWAEHDAQWYVDSRDDMVFEFTTESRDLTVSQTSDAIRRVAASEAEAEAVAFAIWTAQGELVGNVALLVADRVVEISYFWRRPAEGGATHQRPYGSRQSGAFAIWTSTTLWRWSFLPTPRRRTSSNEPALRRSAGVTTYVSAR